LSATTNIQKTQDKLKEVEEAHNRMVLVSSTNTQTASDRFNMVEKFCNHLATTATENVKIYDSMINKLQPLFGAVDSLQKDLASVRKEVRTTAFYHLN